MLDFYGKRFDTVECHSTYRRLPVSGTLERWKAQVPSDFRFVPKAHMGITHRRDLDGLADRVSAFARSIEPLDGQLGPVLLSLPHADPDLGRLDQLLGALSGAMARGCVPAFDLKPRWAVREVLDRLDGHGAALVVTDDDSEPPNGVDGTTDLPLTVGPLVYVRLRRARYNRAQLEAWAGRLKACATEGRDVFAFLKHDDSGDGPRYARQLRAAARKG
jgi:uncharacterized protein YecE (DUF72 family)